MQLYRKASQTSSYQPAISIAIELPISGLDWVNTWRTSGALHDMYATVLAVISAPGFRETYFVLHVIHFNSKACDSTFNFELC